MTRAYLAILCLLGLAVGAGGQTMVPVEQAVADLDATAVSLRRIDPGLGATGQNSRLFMVLPTPQLPQQTLASLLQPYQPEQPVYYRIGPGFRARVDRIDYLVRVGKEGVAVNIAPRKEGEFKELIGPNTVYDLRPQATALNPATAGLPGAGLAEGPMELRPHQVDGRINAQVSGRVGAVVNRPLPIDDELISQAYARPGVGPATQPSR